MNDDEIRRLMHDADPGRTLLPADPDALNSLLEDTMSQHNPETSTNAGTESDDLSRRRKAHRALIAGIAAAVVIGVVGVVVALSLDDPAQDPAQDPAEVPSAGAATTTKLVAGPAVEAKCAAPDAGAVAGQPIALEGKVISKTDELVTLEAIRFYNGTPTDLVQVDKPDLGVTEMPVDFQVGSTYLVGAIDGQVSICGLSGLATDELRALYEKAFPQ